MSTRHIFDSSENLVLKSLRGAVSLNPALRLHPASKSVYVVKPSPELKVAIMSGGGAGHEPAHASYTGDGMLTASVSGDIFASPSSKQILAAIQFAAFIKDKDNHTTEKQRDVLVVINNYTGDRLNFGLAIEKANILHPELKIASVVVSDDVSLINRPSMVGARGLAGNIFVCKILGAAAARGWELNEVQKLGDAVVANLASVGVGMEHCHVPGRKDVVGGNQQKLQLLGARECEIGMGLHNEPGVRKAEIKSPKLLIGELVQMLLDSQDGGFRKTSGVGPADEVALFVNNLGGMSQLEMGAVVDEALTQLETWKIYPVRVYSSSYMTSLNAPGFSISLLNIARIHQSFFSTNISVLQLLDDPTSATSWIGVCSHWPTAPQDRSALEGESSDFLQSLQHSQGTSASIPASHATFQGVENTEFLRQADIPPAVITAAIVKACEKVLSVESELTRFDTILGDGDCGDTFARGARAVLDAIKDKSLNVKKMSPSTLVRSLADIFEESMGGTIGALFSLFFTSWSNALQLSMHSSASTWPTALSSALSSLSHYTPARRGDRTIIDALSPFCASLSAGETFEHAVTAAKDGAASTKGMRAKLGRATYVRAFEDAEETNFKLGQNISDPAAIGQMVKHIADAAEAFVQSMPGESFNKGSDGAEGEIPPDPGAWGVAAIVEGFYGGLSGLKATS